MTKNKGVVAGIVFIILGLAFSAGTHYVFPPCEPAHNAAGHLAPMRCWWTARAEIGLGLAIVFGGVLLASSANAAFRAGVAAMILALAAAAAAMPLGVIGVCASESMRCRMVMLPAQVILAAITAVAALAVLLKCRGKMQ